jgi:hypothetical protein
VHRSRGFLLLGPCSCGTLSLYYSLHPHPRSVKIRSYPRLAQTPSPPWHLYWWFWLAVSIVTVGVLWTLEPGRPGFNCQLSF